MLSLCGERLTPKVLDHYLHHDLIMATAGAFCSFTPLRRPRSPPKFNVLHCTTRTSEYNFIKIHSHLYLWVMLFTNKHTDKPSLPKTQPPLFICLYSLKLNDNKHSRFCKVTIKHSRFCKVTHTRDFHGLQLVLYIVRLTSVRLYSRSACSLIRVLYFLSISFSAAKCICKSTRYTFLKM